MPNLKIASKPKVRSKTNVKLFSRASQSKNFELIQLLLKTSAKSIELPLIEVDAEIQNIIEHLGIMLNCGRVSIYRHNASKSEYQCTHEWLHIASKGFDFKQTINSQNWIIHKYNQLGQNCMLSNIHGLRFNTCSSKPCTQWLSIPFLSKHKSLGFIAIEYHNSTNELSEDLIQTLTLFAGVLENIELRIEQEQLLNLNKRRLSQTENRYQTILENVGDHVFVLNEHYELTYASPKTLNLPIFQGKDIIAKPLKNILDQESFKKLKRQCEEILNFPQKEFSEIYVVKLDNKYRYIEIQLSFHRTSANNHEFIGVARDITNIKAYEKSLENLRTLEQNANNRHRAILENNSVCIISMDFDGRIIDANDYYLNRIGCKNQIKGYNELIGKQVATTIAPEFQSIFKEKLKKCINNPEKHQTVILKEITSNGSHIGGKWELKVQKFKNEDKPIVLGVGFDITEQLKSLEYTEMLLHRTTKQNKRMANLAYVLTHNLRAEAVNIISLAQLLTSIAEDKALLPFKEKIEESSRKLDITIKRLHTIATLGQNKHDENINICSIVNEAYNSQFKDIKPPRPKIINTIPSYIYLSKAAHKNLYDTFCNLISNAYKYKKTDLALEIKTYLSHKNSKTKIVIENNGQTIDFEKTSKATLFELFNPKHKHPDAKAFHLFLNSNQIEEIGGKMDVNNTPNGGVAFSMEFDSRRFVKI
jgi:PAS domain S-box-containing protein